MENNTKTPTHEVNQVDQTPQQVLLTKILDGLEDIREADPETYWQLLRRLCQVHRRALNRAKSVN